MKTTELPVNLVDEFAKNYGPLSNSIGDQILCRLDYNTFHETYISQLFSLTMIATFYKHHFASYTEWRNTKIVKEILTYILLNEAQLLKRISPSTNDWQELILNKRKANKYEIFGLTNELIYQHLACSCKQWFSGILACLVLGDFTSEPDNKTILSEYVSLATHSRFKAPLTVFGETINDTLSTVLYFDRIATECGRQTHFTTDKWLRYSANTLAYSCYFMMLVRLSRIAKDDNIRVLAQGIVNRLEQKFKKLI